MYKHTLYTIRTLTNLHVGSGDTSFGIVDNEVQRDSLTQLPVINSSSLKGAIKEHFAQLLALDNESANEDQVKPFHYRVVFGLDLSEQKELEKLVSEDNAALKNFSTLYKKLPKQGLVKFLDARLLFLPVRGTKVSHYHVTSIETLREFSGLLQSLNISIDGNYGSKLTFYFPINDHSATDNILYGEENDTLEEYQFVAHNETDDIRAFKQIFGIRNLAIAKHDTFVEILEELPVIARNKLIDSVSDNLWYEEVVPRESIFCSVLSYYDNFDNVFSNARNDRDRFEKAFKGFHQKLVSDDEVIQVGANASIGYGLTRFEAIVPYQIADNNTDNEEG